MSCFIMDGNRIARLACELLNSNTAPMLLAGNKKPYDAQTLADAMMAMNLEAYRQRYGLADLIEAFRDGYFLETYNSPVVPAFSPMQTFKSLQCFLYQCSEGDVDQSPLFQALDAMLEPMRRNFDVESVEYHRADWG
jgi:hypothetical protein